MSGTVIKVENLSKEYRLGVIGHGTLYRDLQSWWARTRKREDPNAMLFEDKRKHGDHFMALRGINLEIPAGERLGIIGSNGAGKSTLLKILSRVTGPTSGTVKIKGRVASLLEVGTGFHPELTGRENIYLNGALLGMNRREVDKKFDEIVAFAGVSDFVDTPVKRYSSGMHVRLGFAVAAHLEPDILIVDEVLAVGDAEFQKKCLGKMEDVSQNQGRTVLFVSHNMDAVKRLCQNSVLLQDGMISAQGDTTDIVGQYLTNNVQSVPEYKSDKISFSVKSPLTRIVRIWLTDEMGQLKSVFKHEELIAINFEYEVKSNILGLNPVVHIKGPDGRLIASTADSPGFRKGDVSSQKKLFKPGLHVSRVILPGHLLNEGEYIADVIVNEQHGRAVGSYVTDIVAFTVLQPQVIKELHGMSTAGCIFQQLEWRTELKER